MKVVIMAAGVGTRISRYIEGKPKCTVNIGEIALIEYTIQQLIAHGINDIAMILGYKEEQIRELLKNYPIVYYYNYFYDITNSIASAWFAKDYLNDDVVLMNADVFLEPKLFDLLFEEKRSPILFSDSSRKEEADYKLYYEDHQLIKYGKELMGEEISGEYVGIARMNKEFIASYRCRLEEYIALGYHHMWWEDVLYSFAKEQVVHIKDVIGMFWAEVDFIEDYERILEFRGVRKK